MYIKNNLFINLDDGNHIRIDWSFSNAVKAHKNKYILLKILATGTPVAKILIKYKSNSLEKNNEEEEEPIDINFTEQKSGSEMMKMLLTLDNQVYKKKTRKILIWLTSLIYYKIKLMRKIFKKTKWLFDDCGIVPNEKN